MSKNNTTIPPCTPPQELYLRGRINEDPHWVFQHDVDCNWSPNPLLGFHKHKDPATGTEMPNCCKRHKALADQALEWFSVFPNCCDHHRSLAEARKLIKDNYQFIPEKVVQLISQTEHVIEETIDKPGWEKSITGYIDYCFVSFRLYAIGLNLYLDGVKSFLQNSNGTVEKEKKGKLVDYIENAWHNYKYDVLSVEFFDYDDKIVQEWLEIFPFDLEMFKSERLSSQYFTIPLPYDIKKKCFQFSSIIYSLSEHNLAEYVQALTLELITTIKTSNLFEQGVLTDPEKVKLDLLLRERKLQIEKMKRGDDPHHTEYFEILEKWFEDEGAFLDKLALLLKERKDLLPKKKPMPDFLVKHYAALKEQGVKVSNDYLDSEPKPTTPTKQESLKRTITFSSPEVQEKVFELLKGYFPDREEDLKTALNGTNLSEKLVFPHNQNRLVEVFKRLKYNGFIVESKYQINQWLRENFLYKYERGENQEVRNLSETTIRQLLSSGKGEPKKEQRICSEGIDWLPYKSQATLEREEKKEKL